MAKIRIYELAKELGVSPKELIDMLNSIGITGKVASSSIEDTTARSLRQMIANKDNPEPVAEEVPAAPAAPATFENFRAGGRRFGVPAETIEEVSSEVIQDYRETDGPAGETAGTKPAGGRPEGAPAAAPTPSPTSTAAPGTNGTATPPATGTPTAPSFGADDRFARGKRDLRDFKRGRRHDRLMGVPRFGDRDFQVETESRSDRPAGDKPVITLPPVVTVAELAEKIGQSPATLIKRLFSMSIIRAANQPIESDVAGQLLSQFGYSMEVEKPRTETLHSEKDEGQLVAVPPVVTVMGHVDHGKTSLLDVIRSANVQSGEAGGITQRIGAYETEHNGERIVFLDTPGHEAFTRMRARGAHVTDLAVLVVAADDGVMPQTREAIDHARAAKIPLIVALNKIDRPNADPERVRGQLAEVGLIPEDYGGETVVIPVSAKTGQGVQDLLDMILLMAEIQELKANPDGFAVGTVIEAQQDTQRGPVATVLVHRGTLRVGDHIVVGDVFGRVRAMTDYKGDVLEAAGPKTPVSLTGLSAVPHASDTLQAVGSSREARELATKFAEEAKEGRFVGAGRVSLQELFSQVQKGGVQDLNLIVKADAQGSVEALCQSLEKLAHDEVRVRIIARGAGNVTESDVMLASASNALIIGFAVQLETAATSLADREKIEIRLYNVIYDALNDVKAALEGMLAPVEEDRLAGEAEVLALFRSSRAGVIAGCRVRTGKLVAGSRLRVWRRDQMVYEGRLDSLKHIKADVKEMVAPQECGVSCRHFNEFQEGDLLQSIVTETVTRSIDGGERRVVEIGPPRSAQSG